MKIYILLLYRVILALAESWFQETAREGSPRQGVHSV
jgi:hypothetical protein